MQADPRVGLGTPLARGVRFRKLHQRYLLRLRHQLSHVRVHRFPRFFRRFGFPESQADILVIIEQFDRQQIRVGYRWLYRLCRGRGTSRVAFGYVPASSLVFRR